MTDEVEPWILQYQSSKKWFNSLQSDETKRVYSLRFKQYCDAVSKNPDELLKLKPTLVELVLIMQQKSNVSEIINENAAEDLLDSFLYNGELTENMKVGVKAAVKSFYAANRRYLIPDAGKNVSAPEPKQRTPKIDDLSRLEENMMNVRDRASTARCPNT
jgi:hypothetical protein